MTQLTDRKIFRSPPKAAILCFMLIMLLVCHGLNPERAFAQIAKDSWRYQFEEGKKALAKQRPAKALPYFRKAVEMVEKQSKNRSDREKCMLKVALTLVLLDRPSEARKIYRSLLASVSKHDGANSKQVEPLLMALGSIEEAAGNHNEAMNYYNRALKINESHDGVYSPAYARSLHRIGRVNRRIGNFELAKDNYKTAITILSRDPNLEAASQLKGVLGEYEEMLKGNDKSDSQLIKDFQTDVLQKKQTKDSAKNATKSSADGVSSFKLRPAITAKSNTARSTFKEANESQFNKQSQFQLNALKKGQTDESEAVALRGMQRPESSKVLSPAYSVISDSIFNQQHYKGNVAQYQRKVATDIDALGPHHPSVANDLNSLAQLYIAKKNYREALPLLKRALSIYESAYGLDNLLYIKTLASLANVQYQLGEVEQSIDSYRTALNHGQSALGPNSVETAKILNGLAFVYFQQGRLEEAATYYQWAVSSTESALGDENPLLAACLQDYARVLRRLGKSKKASAVELRASSILGSASN